MKLQPPTTIDAVILARSYGERRCSAILKDMARAHPFFLSCRWSQAHHQRMQQCTSHLFRKCLHLPAHAHQTTAPAPQSTPRRRPPAQPSGRSQGTPHQTSCWHCCRRPAWGPPQDAHRCSRLLHPPARTPSALKAAHSGGHSPPAAAGRACTSMSGRLRLRAMCGSDWFDIHHSFSLGLSTIERSTLSSVIQ